MNTIVNEKLKLNNIKKNSLDDGILILSDNESDSNFHQSLEEGELSSDSQEKKNEPLFQGNANAENIPDEGVSWSELQVLMIGDERVIDYNWKFQKMYPNQHIFHLKNANLLSLCEYIDKHINKTFDIVLIFAFHYDFVCRQTDGKILALRHNVRIENLTKTVLEFHIKWEKSYPGIKIIWVIPAVVNFYQYNSNFKKSCNVSIPSKINENKQHLLSKEYFDYSQKLCQIWRRTLKTISFLPLNDVLFMKKHDYRKSFIKETTPKFPKGYLINGIKPTKLMVGYLAYKLTEFLHEEGFFPLIKCVPSLKMTEDRVYKVDSSLKKYAHRHSRKRNISSHKHKNHKRRRCYSESSSSEESGYSIDSNSSTNERCRPHSGSNHYHNYRYKKDSLSSIVSKQYKIENVKSSSKRSRLSSRRSRSSSQSLSNHLTDTSSLSGSKPCDVLSQSGTIKSISDEVEFYRKLASLREVHDIQCNLYRKIPSSHPLYVEEHSKFLNQVCESNCSSGNPAANWGLYWKNRIEELCNEHWEIKKGQLMIDLQKKKSQKLAEQLEIFSGQEKNVPNLKSDSKEHNKNFESNVLTLDSFEPIKCGNDNPTSSIAALDLIQSPLKKEKQKIKIEDYKRMQRVSSEKSSTNSQSNMSELQDEIKKFLASENIDMTPLSCQTDSPESPEPPVLPEKCSTLLETTNSHKISTQLRSETPLQSPDRSSCYSHSSDSELIPIDSDLDIDELMDNADFLDDLKEIDEEIRKIISPSQISSPSREISGQQLEVPPKVNSPSLGSFLPKALPLLKISAPNNTLQLPKAIVPPNFGPAKVLPQAAILPSISLAHKEKLLPRATVSPLRQKLFLDIEKLHPGIALEVPNRNIIMEEPGKEKIHPSRSEVCLDYANILKMLFRLSKHLGSLGLSITALHNAAEEETRNSGDALCSPDDDAKTILTLVNRKLNSLLKENLSQVQRAIFGEVSGRLRKLLDKLNMQYDKFNNVNIQSIALATVGQDVTQIVAFIKNTLLYHGYSDFESKDVMDLYMSVKAAHSNMGSSS